MVFRDKVSNNQKRNGFGNMTMPPSPTYNDDAIAREAVVITSYPSFFHARFYSGDVCLGCDVSHRFLRHGVSIRLQYIHELGCGRQCTAVGDDIWVQPERACRERPQAAAQS
jgi:hypothetical protein